MYRVLVISTTDSSVSAGCLGSISILSPVGRFMLTLMYFVVFRSHVSASIKGLSGLRYIKMVMVFDIVMSAIWSV